MQDIDGSKQKEFTVAAERGALFRLMTLSKEGVNPDACDESGETPLIKSLNNGHADCAIFLLGQGVNFWQRDRHGQFAIDALLALCPALAITSNAPLPPATVHSPDENGEGTQNADADTQDLALRVANKYSLECQLLKDAYLCLIRSTAHPVLKDMFERLRHDVLGLEEALEAAWMPNQDHKRRVEVFDAILKQEWKINSPRTWRCVAEIFCKESISTDINWESSVIADKLMGWLIQPEHFKSAFEPPYDDALTYTLRKFVQAGIPSRENYEALAVQLLNRGIDPNGTSSEGETPLTQVSKTDSTTLARVLFEAGANLDAKKEGGMTPLMIACADGNLEMARFLTTSGANLNTKNQEGMTPLMIAIRTSHFEIAKMLIEAGADIHLVNNNGTNALHWSAASGDAHIMTLLLAHGADLNSKNKHGLAAIHAAVENSSLNGVKQALMAGQDPNLPDHDGSAPLHLAAAVGDVNIMKLLIDAGADIDRRNGNHETPLEIAGDCNNGPAIAYLLSVIERREMNEMLGQIDHPDADKNWKQNSL